MWPQTLSPRPKPSKQSLDVLIMRYTKHSFSARISLKISVELISFHKVFSLSGNKKKPREFGFWLGISVFVLRAFLCFSFSHRIWNNTWGQHWVILWFTVMNQKEIWNPKVGADRKEMNNSQKYVTDLKMTKLWAPKIYLRVAHCFMLPGGFWG